MSGDDGLLDRFMEQTASLLSLHVGDALPDVVDEIQSFADEYVAALRAKADAADRVRALVGELDADSERAYQRSCGHRDEGSDGQYRAYEDAADRLRHALDGPPC